MSAETDIVVHRHHLPRWLRRLLLAVIFVAALLALLPPAIRLGLERLLHKEGLEQVSIGNVDLNLFTLHFKLDGLSAGHDKQPALKIDQLQLRLAWQPLLHKQVVIDSLALRGVDIDVLQKENGGWRIGDIALPPPSTPAKLAPAGRTSRWSFGVKQMRLEHVTCHLTLPKLRSTVELNTLELRDLYTWRPLQPTRLQLRGAVNGSAVTLKTEATPLASVVTAQAQLSVQQLALAPFMMLAPAGTPTIDGRLSVDSTFDFRGDHVVQQLTQHGTIALSRLAMEQKPWRIAGDNLQWNGGLSVTLEQGDLHALKATGAASADGLGIDGTTRGSARLQVGSVKAGGITLDSPHDIGIAGVAVRNLRVALQRNSHGRLLLPAATKPSTSAATPFSLHVDHITLDGDNRIDFTDRAVKPTYRQTLYISSATLDGLDNRDPGHPAAFRLHGRAGKYTPLELSGKLRPFTKKVNLELHGELKGLELPLLTPYTRRYLGYDLGSGQLTAKTKLKITNDMLNGNNVLHIHELTVEQTDPAKMASFDQQLKIPLDTALYMLKDDNGNIKLELPISGNLNDPSFNLSDAINTALAKTMKLATMSYLKLLLQPYSTLFILASLADGAAAIKLQPLTYPPTVAVLDTQQQPYLDKIADLFKQRPKLQLRLCGFATAADRPATPKNKKPPEESEVTSQLEALARQRAEGVKDLLVTRYGIAPGQLFLCQPQIDTDAAAKPRVELLL